MKNLNKLKVYLAGNIQNSEDSFLWREDITKTLEEFGVTALNPRVNCFLNQVSEDDVTVQNLKKDIKDKKYDQVHEYVQQIIRRDLRMVDVADFLIVNLEPSMPTYGTIHEIIMASIQRKPILFRIDKKQEFPVWLFGLVDHKLIFQTWKEIKEFLQYVNDCDINELDNKYWKIFREDFR